MSNADNIFFTARQKTAEYARSEYIGAIDLLSEAKKTKGEIRNTRAAIVDHYRTTSPKLMRGLDHISSEMTNIASSVAQIANIETDILAEVELFNRNLVKIEATLDAGFELISVQLEKGNSLLRDIASILSSPVATQANEYLARAKAYLHDGFFEEAEEDLRKVVELDQANYCAWYLIGLIRCQSASDRDGALTAFEKCNKYSSVRSKHYYSRSLFEQALVYHLVDNESEEAISTLMLSIEADKKNYQSHFCVAELLAASGKLEEAAQHLKICVNADVIYFLRSSSSKALVDSSLHDRFFNKRSEEFQLTNSSLSDLLGSFRNVNNEITKWSGGAIGFGSNLEKFASLESATAANDYLAQRELRRIGSKLADALRVNIRTSSGWLLNDVEAARNKLEADTATVKQKTKEEVSNKQLGFSLLAAILIGGGVIVWLLLEIVRAFQTNILEGIAATILIVIFGVFFLVAAVVGWASISVVLSGLIALVGEVKSVAIQSKIKTRGQKEIASRDDLSKRFINELDQLKTALEPF